MVHINIAVCDDDPAVSSGLAMLLEALLRERSINCAIDIFSNGEELCRKIQQYKYDLLFLDIGLPGQNGIEVGHFIRDKLLNEQIPIVYMSSQTDQAMRLFELHPINFLEKPLTADMLRGVVDRYLRIAGRNSQIFTYHKNRQNVHIAIPDILYFENIKRQVRIVTSHGEDEFYGSLKQIYPQLQDQGFLFIHYSFLVNGNRIISYEYDQILMDNHILLPISQSHRKNLKNSYSKTKVKEQ